MLDLFPDDQIEMSPAFKRLRVGNQSVDKGHEIEVSSQLWCSNLGMRTMSIVACSFQSFALFSRNGWRVYVCCSAK